MSTGNTICWADIPVNDLARASKFDQAVLGEPLKQEKMGEHEFTLLPHAQSNVSGCLVKLKDNKPSQTGPLLYLSAEGRLDQAVAAVEANGGKILEPKKPIGPYGHRAIILDSEGNRIALHSQKA